MRKLASIQTIKAIEPIVGADRIVAAKVLSWTVVVGRDEFQVGQNVVFFEPDTFLPGDREEFASFMDRGKKKLTVNGNEIEGHVLRTAKLRGVYSQGLLMDLSVLCLSPELPVGTDVTDLVEVFKYDPPIPADNGRTVGSFDTRLAPKTDAVRAQSFTDHDWALIQTIEWEPTLKLDGTSRTLSLTEEGELRVFGRNWELDPSQDAATKVAERDKLLVDLPNGWTVQGELVGPGIQANRLKLSDLKLVPFAVWDHGIKVSRDSWPESVVKHATPVLGDEFLPRNFTSVEEALSFVDKLRNTAFGSDTLAEGVVFHPVDPSSVPEKLHGVLDRNLNWKLISPTFLVKNGE